MKKLRIPCMQCFPSNEEPIGSLLEKEIEDGGVYEIVCAKGHQSSVIVQNPKFEILINRGCLALLDEYPREAVFNFIAAIEEFHRFSIEIFLNHKEVKREEYNNTWSFLKNSSERQLGAFYLLYLQALKKVPPKFVEDKAAFRNKVIHKGCLPSLHESKKYAKESFNYLFSLMKEIRSNLRTDFDMVLGNYVTGLRRS